ncbi:MAG: hypothetical protein VX498_12875 [Myxococcota bacterium]|nr:hypothetical protein [Myxococcota bacterium]
MRPAFLTLTAFVSITLALAGCVSPPSPEGSSSEIPESTGGGEAADPGGAWNAAEGQSAGGAAGAAAGQDGNAAPEFKAIRAAIQPITELNVALGKALEENCQKAESSIAATASSTADRHLMEMFKGVMGEAGAELPSEFRAGLHAAMIKDVAAVSQRAGAPTIKLVETLDKDCGKTSKACDVPSPGARCFTATVGDATECACALPAEPTPEPEPVPDPTDADTAPEKGAEDGESEAEEAATSKASPKKSDKAAGDKK